MVLQSHECSRYSEEYDELGTEKAYRNPLHCTFLPKAVTEDDSPNHSFSQFLLAIAFANLCLIYIVKGASSISPTTETVRMYFMHSYVTMWLEADPLLNGVD